MPPAGTTLQSRALLSALEPIPGLHIYGLTDPQRLEDCVATFSFRRKKPTSAQDCWAAGKEGDLRLGCKILCPQCHREVGRGRQRRHGMSKAAHYNTLEEVERLKDALLEISVG